MPAPTGTSVRRNIDIDAPASLVWGLLSDLPAMGRLSPENVGGRWLGGATGPAVGATFRGNNRRGWRRWSTRVVVTAAEPGRRFSFDVSSLGLPVSRWTYDVADRPGGCLVTETWEDRRGRVIDVLGRLVSGVDDREAFTARSIERTLATLKASAESSASAAST